MIARLKEINLALYTNQNSFNEEKKDKNIQIGKLI